MAPAVVAGPVVAAGETAVALAAAPVVLPLAAAPILLAVRRLALTCFR